MRREIPVLPRGKVGIARELLKSIFSAGTLDEARTLRDRFYADPSIQTWVNKGVNAEKIRLQASEGRKPNRRKLTLWIYIYAKIAA